MTSIVVGGCIYEKFSSKIKVAKIKYRNRLDDQRLGSCPRVVISHKCPELEKYVTKE
jgi:hypothetical protein